MENERAERELTRAKKALQAAEMLFEEELYEDCVSRSYYAVLHAAKSALSIIGIMPESHDAVRRLFGLHLIKTGKIEKEFSKILKTEYKDREIADYAADLEIDRDRANLRVKQENNLFKELKIILKKIRIISDQFSKDRPWQNS